MSHPKQEQLSQSAKLKEEIMKELLRINNLHFSESLRVLNHYKLLEYVNLTDLLKIIGDKCDRSSKMVELLKQQYEQEVKTSPKNCIFPILKDNSLTAVNDRRISLFIQTYVSESTKKKKEQTQSQTQPNELPPKEPRRTIQLKLAPKTSYYSNTSPEQFKKIEQNSNNQNNQQQATENTPPSFQGVQKQFKGAESKIPDFYFQYDNIQRSSIRRFLALDVTEVFQLELNDVVESIRRQMVKGKFLFEVYNEFAINFLRFYYLREGKCELAQPERCEQIDKFFKDYTSNYLSKNNTKVEYCFPESSSQLLQYWDLMKDRLAGIINDALPDSQTLKVYILQLLENISLFYCPNIFGQRLYAEYHKRCIFVNLTVITSYPHGFSKFKRDLLKPYLFTCICHEITHGLARILCKEQLGKSNKSLTLKNRATMGCKILKFTRKKSRHLCAMLIKMQVVPSVKKMQKFNVQTITNKIAQARFLAEKCQHIAEIFEQNKILLTEVEKDCQAINYVFSIFRKMILNDEIQQYLLIEAVKHLKLNEGENQHIMEAYASKENQYRAIFAILNACLKIPILFTPHLQIKANMLNTVKRKSFYIQQNPIFEEFILTINQNQDNFFKSKQVERFISLFLSSNIQPIDLLKEKIEKIVSNFTIGEVKQLLLAIRSMQISDYENCHLFNFCGNSKTLMKDQDIKKIFELEKSYNQLMDFLKFSELYLIAVDVPHFYLRFLQQQFQSGFDVEFLIWPNVHRQTKFIFAKDYYYMQNLTKPNSQLIGVEPSEYSQARKTLFVGREGQQQTYDGFNMGGMICGTRIDLAQNKNANQSEDDQIEENAGVKQKSTLELWTEMNRVGKTFE